MVILQIINIILLTCSQEVLSLSPVAVSDMRLWHLHSNVCLFLLKANHHSLKSSHLINELVNHAFQAPINDLL